MPGHGLHLLPVLPDLLDGLADPVQQVVAALQIGVTDKLADVGLVPAGPAGDGLVRATLVREA